MFLDMPEALLMSYAEQMPKMRALWVMDAAQAALFGQLAKTKSGGGRWWREWSKRARGSTVISKTESSVREFRSWARAMFGSGYSD